MKQIERRGFLKVLSTIIGTATIATYVEPLFSMTESYTDWIEDKGDFFIVRVPAFKHFSRELLEKPTIFILGEKSIVSDVIVNGYTNVSVPYGGYIFCSRFDASRSITQTPRSPLTIIGDNLQMEECHIIGNEQRVAGIHVLPSTNRFSS